MTLLYWCKHSKSLNAVYSKCPYNGLSLSRGHPQLYNFSLLWIFWCWTRCLLCLNSLPQTSQLYGFSLLWIIWCSTWFPFLANCFSQTAQLNGFSLLWITDACFRCLIVYFLMASSKLPTNSSLLYWITHLFEDFSIF